MRHLNKLLGYFFDTDGIDRFAQQQNADFSAEIGAADRLPLGEIEQRVCAILAKEFPDLPLSSDALVDGGALDSLSLVTLCALFSDAFSVDISYKDISPEHFNSTARMAGMIASLLAAGGTQNAKTVTAQRHIPEPVLDIPWTEAEKSVVQRVLECAERESETTAIIVNGRPITYAVFARHIRAYRQAFAKMGVARGDAVILHAICEECYLACLFALHLCGAVVVPVEKAIGGERVLELAADTKAKLIVTDTALKSAFGERFPLWADYADVEAAAPAIAPSGAVEYPDLDTDALILFTTGSTGSSKGVVVTHRVFSWMCVSYAITLKIRRHTRMITTFPLNHISGLYSTVEMLSCCGTIILADGVKNLDILFSYLQKYRPNRFSIPPMAVQIMIQSGYRLLRSIGAEVDDIGFGSEPMPLHVLQTMHELFPNANIRNVYACTEVCYITSAETRSDEQEVALGLPFIGAEIALRDESGRISSERGKTGQICVKSKMQMRCYHGQSELTAASFDNGWFVMSDMGYLGEDGVLYFRGRADDVITVAGYKISPVEVEDAAGNSQLLRECICIRGEDAAGLPFLRLLVVPKEPESFSESALRSYLAAHLEAYRIPRTIEVVDAVQRNKNGKIDRKYYRNLQ